MPLFPIAEICQGVMEASVLLEQISMDSPIDPYNDSCHGVGILLMELATTFENEKLRLRRIQVLMCITMHMHLSSFEDMKTPLRFARDDRLGG